MAYNVYVPERAPQRGQGGLLPTSYIYKHMTSSPETWSPEKKEHPDNQQLKLSATHGLLFHVVG